MDKGTDLHDTSKPGPYHLEKDSKDMSLKHTKDTLEYNLRHAEDHLKKARESCEKLERYGVNDSPKVSKELLSLFDYFEKEETSENKDKDAKLKGYIKRTYK